MYTPIIKMVQILYTFFCVLNALVDQKNQLFEAELYITHADLFVSRKESIMTMWQCQGPAKRGSI
jgi:hypothetical protein